MIYLEIHNIITNLFSILYIICMNTYIIDMLYCMNYKSVKMYKNNKKSQTVIIHI